MTRKKNKPTTQQPTIQTITMMQIFAPRFVPVRVVAKPVKSLLFTCRLNPPLLL